MMDSVIYPVCKETNVLSPAQSKAASEDGLEPGSDQRSPTSKPLSRLSWVILCSSMLLAETQAALDSTMTADIQPNIIDTFGEISKFPWINFTYNLGLGGTCLLWAKLLVHFESKKIVLAARLLFAIGSTLTAAAPSMDVFIIGKAITGIGGSGSYISIMNIISDFVPLHKQGRYFGYIGFTWGLGTIIGPLVGGAFAVTAAGWRWSFYFNSILGGITFPVFMLILPSRATPASPGSPWARARRIDAVGFMLYAGALCSGIMAVSFGGALYLWSSSAIIGLFCCSGVLWIMFAVQQATATLTTKENRILPVHILRSWEMWILIFQTGCATSVLFITIYYVPLYLQFVRGETAIQSAVNLLPFLSTCVSAMLVSGHLISGFGYYKLWFLSGSILTLTMSVCLYTTEIDTPQGKICGYLVLGGIGLGLYAMNAGPVMVTIVGEKHSADASTVFGCADTLSGTFSVGIANSIFVNRATDSIQEILPDTSRGNVQEAIAGTGASFTDQLPPSTRKAVLQASLDAIKDAWAQVIATAALSLVLSFFLRNRKLSDLSKERSAQ